MSLGNRPLSPHLQIYRWQITMTLSILHRLSGLALALGTLLLVWWLAAAAAGPQAFAAVQDFIGSPLGGLLLFGWSVALFYHLANGVRHLAWDMGYGFSIEAFYRSGWAVIAATAVMTAVAWIVGIYLLPPGPAS